MSSTAQVLDTASAKHAVESAVARYFAQHSNRALDYGADFHNLWSLAARCSAGGKLVRPVLFLESYSAVSGRASVTQDPTALTLAVAIELLHFALLLHDDVIDGDRMRRGQPNLIGALASVSPGASFKEEANRRGLGWERTSAILMGNLLLSHVHQMFARLDVDNAKRVRLLDLLDHAITESIVGEHLDVGLDSGAVAPDSDVILAMTQYKTATYSFALPVRAAAMLVDAGDDTDRQLATASGHLGLAFQLQDDYLSVFGEPATHGKEAYADLRAGKQTALIAYARGTGSWSAIEPLLGRADLTDAQGETLVLELRECGAEDYILRLIDLELSQFNEVIARADIPTSMRGVFERLIAHLRSRQV